MGNGFGRSAAYEFGRRMRKQLGGRMWQEVEEELASEWNLLSGQLWEEVKDEVRAGWSAVFRGSEPSKGFGTEGALSAHESAPGGSWEEGGSDSGFRNETLSVPEPAEDLYRPGSPIEAEPPPAPASTIPTSSPPAYALLSCPEVVVAKVEFDLTVGLSPERMSPDDEPLDLPQSPEVRLTVHVVADGFRLRAGESERNELTVTSSQPYPRLVLHLTPVKPESPLKPRLIRATYSVGGQTIGVAVRPVVVARNAQALRGAEPEKAPQPTTIRIPTAGTAPDLTVHILLKDSDGGLLWTLESPHPVELPAQGLKSDIGGEPERFARQLVDKVNVREGKSGLYTFLLGHGRKIAARIPPEVWQALLDVAEAKRSGEPLSVLILSEEPYVPWELAAMPEPLLDPAAPPFLAAQVTVGRWALPSGGRPKLPPPTELSVTAMAVVSGIYDDPDFRPLEQAVQETADLEQLYAASKVDATFDDVSDCLQGDPGAEVLHFAVHGIYDPKGIQNGLVLTDKRTLDPADVEGVDLARAPFVFLNACQVGAGDQVLGDYSGLAAAFLFAGASGVIAPLWSVKDEVAREIALSFYRQVAEGRPPAAVLRGERARFDADASTATCLAYQFFGHPHLRLVGLHPQEEDHR